MVYRRSLCFTCIGPGREIFRLELYPWLPGEELEIRIRFLAFSFVLACLTVALPTAGASPLETWRSGDRVMAIADWRRLAAQGDADANLFLAYLYRRGIELERDDTRAADHFRAAALAGSPEAQYQLGLMYELGIGLVVDTGEASRWYGLSSGQVCPDELDAGAVLRYR